MAADSHTRSLSLVLHLLLLAILRAALSASSDTEPEIQKIEKPPYVIRETENTLILSLHSERLCRDRCLPIWQYKEQDESVWHLAGRRHIFENMEITGLNASTVYLVRAFVQNDSESDLQKHENVPYTVATTLPVLDPINPEHHPEVIKAGKSFLTMITGCNRKGYVAHWEYKKEARFAIWKVAGKELANREMTITNLEPDTTYYVRFKLHWPTSTNYSIYSSSGKVRTCPNPLPEVSYIWSIRRGSNFLKVEWSVNLSCRVQFLIRWKPYDSTDERIGFPIESYDANKCPLNATLVKCVDTNSCFDTLTHLYTFSVPESLTSGTRYFFEVAAVDWEGKCSESKTLETATPISYWGGITFGLWVLIILGMILLFAAVPACILIKKRVAARVAAGRNVTFNVSSNGSGPNGEDIGDADSVVFHEPTTRILDRRSETLDT